MSLWYAIGAVVLFFVLLELLPDVRRLVYTNVSLNQLLSSLMPAWLLPACNGACVMIYHRSSDTLFRVSKRLHPNFDPAGEVILKVEHIRVSNPRKERLANASSLLWMRMVKTYMATKWPSSTWGWANQVTVWVWNLPSGNRGDVLEVVDCGNSLRRAVEAVRQQIEEAEPIRENPAFDVWNEGRIAASWRTLGVFSDEREQ